MLLKEKFILKADISEARWEGPSHSLSHQGLLLLPFHTAAFTWHVDTFRLPQGSGRMESSGHTEPPFQSTVTHRGVGFKSWLNDEIVLLRKVLGFITKFS